MKAAAGLYRLLGDEVRLRILRLLAAERLNVSELTAVLGLAQSGVSRHLGLLKESGLVSEQREGGFTYYRASDAHRDGLHTIRGTLAAQFAASAGDAPEIIHFGPFSFRFDRGELRRGDEVVRITEREREILTILGSATGDNVPREALSGNGAAANERTVDVQINRLRRKIEVDPANPLLLQTVRGIGYRLVIDR